MTPAFRGLAQTIFISTHTLTWSVTKVVKVRKTDFGISTHTLTWSVTCSLIIITDPLIISTHTLTWSVTQSKSV